MDYFTYRDGQLFCEDVNIDQLAATVGTPFYVYSRKTFEHHYDAIIATFADLNPLICFSIKSCSNINLLKLLANRSSGMDIVSEGELFRAQHAGVSMDKVVYAGAGKTDDEILAALQAQIGYFNIESQAEFENIASIARAINVTSQAALRINPDVYDEKTPNKTTTGKKETKFGIDIDQAHAFFQRYSNDDHLRLNAIHLHIGSPISDPNIYVKAIKKTLDLIDTLRDDNFTIDTINIGGGFAADYETDTSPQYDDYASAIIPLLKNKGLNVILEPGRTIAANAGILITRAQYIKNSGSKKFIIVDSGMNHLIRPSMYDAFHFIWPTKVAPDHVPAKRLAKMPNISLESCDVVGPICETGDAFAIDRPLPPVTRGELLAIFTAGAYSMTMASNYNAQPRPTEVLVEDDKATVIRNRETYDEMISPELDPKEIYTET